MDIVSGNINLGQTDSVILSEIYSQQLGQIRINLFLFNGSRDVGNPTKVRGVRPQQIGKLHNVLVQKKTSNLFNDIDGPIFPGNNSCYACRFWYAIVTFRK